MKSATLRKLTEETQSPYLIPRSLRGDAEAQQRKLGKGVLAGVIGGFIGTVMMTRFQNAWSKASEALQSRISSQKGQGEQKQQGGQENEDATMKAAAKIASVVHYTFGTLQGALYGGLIELSRTRGGLLPALTFGSGPGLTKLFNDFFKEVEFISIYVREAHPGERYPHHSTDEQKMRHARDWAREDRVVWSVAVDSLDGKTHKAYGALPNSVYLIDRTGRVAFRALWAGQEGLLRDKIQELLKRESQGEYPVNLGQQENLVIPLIHGAAGFDHAVGRGGEKSKEDFRREMGNVMYSFERLMSKMEPIINPPEQPAA